MLRKKRTDEDDAEQGGQRPVQPFMLTNADAVIIKELAGKQGFTPLPKAPASMLRRMREAGLVELLDHPTRGLCAELTTEGEAAVPQALKLLAAAGAMQR